MRILIDTEELPEAFQWDPTAPKRGTEEFYVRTAECLGEMGHDVVVAYDGLDDVVRGVRYMSRGSPVTLGADAVIECNRPSRTRGLQWSNRYDHAVQGAKPDVVLSHFHRALAGGGTVIGHGCDPERLVRPTSKAPIAAFTGSPDRGLGFLRSVWPDIERATGVRLVASEGKMTMDEVDALYRAAKFWVHPGLGIELFCISALKAQVAGCIPIVVPHMALDETVKFGCKTSVWDFREAAIECILNPPAVAEVTGPTWMDVTKQLRELL